MVRFPHVNDFFSAIDQLNDKDIAEINIMYNNFFPVKITKKNNYILFETDGKISCAKRKNDRWNVRPRDGCFMCDLVVIDVLKRMNGTNKICNDKKNVWSRNKLTFDQNNFGSRIRFGVNYSKNTSPRRDNYASYPLEYGSFEVSVIYYEIKFNKCTYILRETNACWNTVYGKKFILYSKENEFVGVDNPKSNISYVMFCVKDDTYFVTPLYSTSDKCESGSSLLTLVCEIAYVNNIKYVKLQDASSTRMSNLKKYGLTFYEKNGFCPDNKEMISDDEFITLNKEYGKLLATDKDYDDYQRDILKKKIRFTNNMIKYIL